MSDNSSIFGDSDSSIFGGNSGSIFGGAIGTQAFRAGYSACFGVLIALLINLIVIMIFDLAFRTLVDRQYGKSAVGIILFSAAYVFAVSIYVSGAFDNLNF